MKIFGPLLGTATVYLTWRVGRHLFDPAAGFIAAIWAAIYPYYVWHDAVLQENAVLATVVLVAVLLLLLAQRSPASGRWLAAGLACGLVLLTKANLTLFVVAALLWVFLAAPGSRNVRLRWVALAALAALAIMAPWVIRTWRLTGAPVLYSNGGFALSTSNNALTFDYFPAQSIDRAEEPERVAFTPTQRAELEAITDPRGIAQSAWYWRQGMDFIRSHPGLTLWRAVRKMDVAWSPVFSPAKGAAFESVYLAFYLPLLVLAPIGIWRSRHRWRETGYIVAIFVMFTLGAGVFWAHTSHRMYVEPYLMIFAAAVVTGRASAALPDHR